MSQSVPNGEPANSSARCLRCGYEFGIPLGPGEQFAFCSTCVPWSEPSYIRTSISLDLRETSIIIVNSPTSATPAGSAAADSADQDLAEPVVVTPTYGEEILQTRAANTRYGPMHVRFNIKLGREDGPPLIRINIDLNLWSSTRNQFEDRLVWTDKPRDEYLEVLAKAGDSEVVWTSGWTSLAAHSHGAPRQASSVMPDISLPVMRTRRPARFAPNYPHQ